MSEQKSKKFIFYWDILISLLATYAAIEIPCELALHFTPPLWVISANWLVTICFAADIFIRFLNPDGNKKKQHTATETKENKYPRKWLIVDLLSALPFDLAAAFVPALSFLRLIKILKVSRIVSFRSAWQYGMNANPFVVRFGFFFYFLALSAHWIACGWFSIRVSYNEVITPGLPVNIVNEYVQALYWSVTTITTIGYGDITPNKAHNVEMIFAICVQIFGAGAFGYTIGNIANMLTNIDMGKARHQERVDRMNSFMKSKKIPQKLQEQVYQYYNYLWDTRRGYNDVTILSELPESFKYEFAMLLNRSIIEKVPLFKGADPHLVREVIYKLKPHIFVPGDTICMSGEIGDKMYFINKGSVEVISQDGKHVYAILKEGDFFGEIALLLKQPRNATIRAVDYCDLSSLDKESFDQVLSNYPVFEKHIKNLAQERMRTFANT